MRAFSTWGDGTRRRRIARGVLAAGAVAALAGAASARGTKVTEFTGGVTPGLSADAEPTLITTGPDLHVWFTERANPGRVGFVNGDGSVREFTGGVTPGFSTNSLPDAIATGPDRNVWFVEQQNPGRL